MLSSLSMTIPDSCNRYRCSHSKSINRGSELSSTNTGINYKLRMDTNGATTDVIYLITCKRCDKQYAGQTTQHVAKLMNSHCFDISNCMDPMFESLVASHFNSIAHWHLMAWMQKLFLTLKNSVLSFFPISFFFKLY